MVATQQGLIHRGEPKVSRWKFWQRELTLDSFVTFLLALGIFCMLQGSLFIDLQQQGMYESLTRKSEFTIRMSRTVTDSQVQTFLQAVLALPQTKEAKYITKAQQYEFERKRDPSTITFFESSTIANPFQDIVKITLRSSDDTKGFLDFLKRPELASVLDPTFLPDILDQLSERKYAIGHKKLMVYADFALVCFFALLAFLVTLQIVRVSVKKRRSELLVGYLSGASSWFLRRGVFVETLSLLLSALAFASIIIVMVFSIPTLPFVESLELALMRQWGFWILLCEVFYLFVMGYFSVIIGVQSAVLAKMCKSL